MSEREWNKSETKGVVKKRKKKEKGGVLSFEKRQRFFQRLTLGLKSL